MKPEMTDVLEGCADGYAKLKAENEKLKKKVAELEDNSMHCRVTKLYNKLMLYPFRKGAPNDLIIGCDRCRSFVLLLSDLAEENTELNARVRGLEGRRLWDHLLLEEV